MKIMRRDRPLTEEEKKRYDRRRLMADCAMNVLDLCGIHPETKVDKVTAFELMEASISIAIDKIEGKIK